MASLQLEIMRAFISYRREDSFPISGRLFDRLAQRLGRDNVFMDVDSIPPGADFTADIADRIAASSVMLVVIGDRWLSVVDDHGNARIQDPRDLVAQEIAQALEKNITTIPILIDNVSMPSDQQLPSRIAALSKKNAFQVRNARFNRDVDALMDEITPRRGAGLRGILFIIVVPLICVLLYAAWRDLLVGRSRLIPDLSPTLQQVPSVSRKIRIEMLERLKREVDLELDALHSEVNDNPKPGFGARAQSSLQNIYSKLDKAEVRVARVIPPSAGASIADFNLALQELSNRINRAIEVAKEKDG